MTKLRAFFASLDARDFVGALGVVMLAVGGELLYRGAGVSVAGAVLIAIAVLVR